MTVRSPTLREVRSVVRPSRPGDGQPCGQALHVPEECPGVLGGGEFPAAPLISIHQGVATSASTRPLSPGRAQWASILPAAGRFFSLLRLTSKHGFLQHVLHIQR